MKRYLAILAATWFLSACSSGEPELVAQLEQQSVRITQLEEQLSELSTRLHESEKVAAEHEEKGEGHASMEAGTFELAVAQYVMDTAGFHAIDDSLSETGEIDPASAAAVARVARVVTSTRWPDKLADDAAHLHEVLADLQTALSEDDVQAATPLAAIAHERQHDLSTAISAILSEEIEEHAHEDEG